MVITAGGEEPTEAEEASAVVLRPRLTLAAAGVTDGGSLLAFVAGSPGASCLCSCEVDAHQRAAGALAQLLSVEASPGASASQCPLSSYLTPHAAGTRLADAPSLIVSSTYPDVFMFRESGEAQEQVLRTFFLDPGLLLVTELKGWIGQLRQRHIGFNRQGDDSALSLFLSGAPKTGKSLLLSKVIPALLREDVLFGVGQAAEARVWQVDTTRFDRRNGAAGFLSSLLDKLIFLASREAIKEVAHFKPGPLPYSTVSAALEDFVFRLPRNRPTFILLDEVQNFFLLEKEVVGADGTSRRVLDEGEIMTMRRAFKPLVGSSPLHCIWVLTGSRMALFWANIALCPVNGYSLLTHIPTVRLPTSVPEAVKLQAWEVLRCEYLESELPQLLFDMSPQHHASLVFFCNEWLRMGRPVDSAAFVLETLTSKVYPEIVEDYRVVLETLSKGQRKSLLELLNSAMGVSERDIPRGVSAFLKGDLKKLFPESPGRLEVYLDSPLVSRAIQALMDGDGELLKGDDPSATMLSLTERDEMRAFGEQLNKPHALAQPLLEEMASSVEACFWKSDWFKAALDDNLQQQNPRIANAYARAQADKTANGQELKPWEHMRVYLQLWSNCVRHAESKQMGLAHVFVKTFPQNLWVFARTGEVQRMRSALSK